MVIENTIELIINENIQPSQFNIYDLFDDRMWTWTIWQRVPMASLELILQRSASGHVSWLSERASRMRSAERGRGRPTRQQWSVMVLSHSELYHTSTVLYLFCVIIKIIIIAIIFM